MGKPALYTRHYFLKPLIRFCCHWVVLGLAACGKPDKELNDNTPQPKPYNLAVPFNFREPVIPADNPLTEEGIYLGRALFYEKKLSANNNISCGSCHQQQFAFTNGTALSIGTDGKPGTRNAMMLANLAWQTSFNWDGVAKTLEAQARIPLEDHLEMNQPLAQSVDKLQNTPAYPKLFAAAFGSPTITSDNILKALAQFQRTLVSSGSKFDKFLQDPAVFTKDEREGYQLFLTHPVPEISLRGGNCGDCHNGPLLTLEKFHNNGLDAVPQDQGVGALTGKPTDMGKFKAPSLRNIALTAPYMHDGRFKTLEEVLDHYNEHINLNSPNIDPLILEASNEVKGKSLALTPLEKDKIIKFLHTLTDAAFVEDKRFSEITIR